jgi:hypothetical protein
MYPAHWPAGKLMKADTPNRSMIALAGVLTQVALGAVYAWSVFRIPLTQRYGWSVPQVTVAFELAVLVLVFASFAGSLCMWRSIVQTSKLQPTPQCVHTVLMRREYYRDRP